MSQAPDRTPEPVIAARTPEPEIAVRTRRRITLRIMPFLFFLYILAYLDRTNVSVAQLSMKEPVSAGGLAFTSTVIGWGTGIFFWGYWILEIPSTISVLKWGASWVFARILVLWGLSCTLIGSIGLPFAHSLFAWLPKLPMWLGDFAIFWNGLPDNAEYQFYFFRFMLGVFEGGFFPSVILYLSLWYRACDRGKAIAMFMSAIPVSSLIGTPLSGWMLGLDWYGLAGWRWVFILQGVVPVFAGVATLFVLPNRPTDAKWLPDDEREWLKGELDREQHGREHHGHWEWLKNPLPVLLLTCVYFCFNIVSYGMSTFMPAIIKSQLPQGVTNLTVTCVTALPYLLAWGAMTFNGWHSDRTRERVYHVALPLLVLSGGLFAAFFANGNPTLQLLITIMLVGTFLYSHLPCFWPIPSMFLGTAAAASAIGFINMIGNLGGSVGPVLVGTAAEGQSTYGAGLLRLAPWPIVAATIIIVVSTVRASRHNEKAVNETPAGSPARRKGLAARSRKGS